MRANIILPMRVLFCRRSRLYGQGAYRDLEKSLKSIRSPKRPFKVLEIDQKVLENERFNYSLWNMIFKKNNNVLNHDFFFARAFGARICCIFPIMIHHLRFMEGITLERPFKKNNLLLLSIRGIWLQTSFKLNKSTVSMNVSGQTSTWQIRTKDDSRLFCSFPTFIFDNSRLCLGRFATFGIKYYPWNYSWSVSVFQFARFYIAYDIEIWSSQCSRLKLTRGWLIFRRTIIFLRLLARQAIIKS